MTAQRPTAQRPTIHRATPPAETTPTPLTVAIPLSAIYDDGLPPCRPLPQPSKPPVADARAGYLAALGERVRVARTRQGMARKELARRSGVSERHLAQLENGAGNISILLLRAVAQAVGLPLTALVEDHTSAAGQSGGSVALVGMAGGGRAALGRALSARLGMPLLMLDAEVERAAGLPVAELIALCGSDAHTVLERRCLDAALERCPAAVIVAGGLATPDSTLIARLREVGTTVWLRAPVEDMARRLFSRGRTGESSPDVAQALARTHAQRAAVYGLADLVMDLGTSRDGVEACAEDLLRRLPGHGVGRAYR